MVFPKKKKKTKHTQFAFEFFLLVFTLDNVDGFVSVLNVYF